ncbi:hypothetical protein DE146DRAFT_639584 [Phaeosphaeria sp. MPI-PUGE-AT-0046c]|nr:hypothetical protein DE146DRAFT_639584 [Phaeosphaeria sp. MPI-PUGE-AT-0046c]
MLSPWSIHALITCLALHIFVSACLMTMRLPQNTVLPISHITLQPRGHKSLTKPSILPHHFCPSLKIKKDQATPLAMFAFSIFQPAQPQPSSGESISHLHLPQGPSAHIPILPTNTRPHATCSLNASLFSGRLQAPRSPPPFGAR